NRNEFVKEAMKLYIRERHKIVLREKMRQGYEEMAIINVEWTEVGIRSENNALEVYESILSESE
ncbi:MAG: CopG family transcriptional regulator, partial [Clostridiales bacterium]|nr:CopG family transcriptional regulator [Clostridiales bacterium]